MEGLDSEDVICRNAQIVQLSPRMQLSQRMRGLSHMCWLGCTNRPGSATSPDQLEQVERHEDESAEALDRVERPRDDFGQTVCEAAAVVSNTAALH